MKPKCPRCGKHSLHKNGTGRWICREGSGDRAYCYSTRNPEATGEVKPNGEIVRTKPLVFSKALAGKKTFIITAAQNATPVHTQFFAALEMAAAWYKAELIVIPLRYKNPTSRWTESQENAETWAPEVQPYLCNQRKRLSKNLMLMGDVKIQPTAVNPLSGFEAITHGESSIFGHTKLQLKTVATPQNQLAKILTTTGACTVPNYTDTRAGKLGDFHHSLAACLVEIEGNTFHLRQLNGSRADGSFYDLTNYFQPYSNGDVTVAETVRAKALVLGDWHNDFLDPGVLAATFEGAGNMVEVLNPEKIVWHDVDDGYGTNPHQKKDGDPFVLLGKHRAGRGDVLAEVERTIQFICDHTQNGRESLIVSSNHTDFLRRWLGSNDWRKDPENAEFYLKLASEISQATKMTPNGVDYPDPFAYLVRQGAALRKRTDVRCLGPDESYQIEGVEIGMHGHLGPNGARGSRRNLARIGVKSIVGHSHSPGIEEGCYQVGTSSRLRLEYNRGPSSWMHTHCVVYPNGKRSLLNIVNGQWRRT